MTDDDAKDEIRGMRAISIQVEMLLCYWALAPKPPDVVNSKTSSL